MENLRRTLHEMLDSDSGVQGEHVALVPPVRRER
jgi:hypothetical protein